MSSVEFNHDLRYNYYALLAAIRCEGKPTTNILHDLFEWKTPKVRPKRNICRKLSMLECEEIINLKAKNKNVTWKKVASVYGVTKSSAFRQVAEYRRSKEND